jgi:2,4-dienoyl-CoA reductase-like NADH-dependent reductase (Old Yellow Enzyme family)
MSRLFSSLQLRGLTCRNRVFLSPMCMYSSQDGYPNAWHLAHLGSRAVGGAGLIMVEATAVTPEGRISPSDCGLWEDGQAEAFRPIVDFIAAQGAIPAIQLAHAGRKGSSLPPAQGSGPCPAERGGWPALAPSPLPFAPGYPPPEALSLQQIENTVAHFAAAACRALTAGFQVAEVHMAHGYLLHQFLSPLSNQRDDVFGGSLENRMRLPLQVARTVRDLWPAEWPVFVRISASDWVAGGWDLPQSIALCRSLKGLGIDLIDTSSAGLIHDAPVPAGPGFQVPFAAAIRQQVDIPTGAVGFITDPAQAEQIIATGQADVVFLGRELLRNPHWPITAARALGVDIPWPVQYQRAKV